MFLFSISFAVISSSLIGFLVISFYKEEEKKNTNLMLLFQFIYLLYLGMQQLEAIVSLSTYQKVIACTQCTMSPQADKHISVGFTRYAFGLMVHQVHENKYLEAIGQLGNVAAMSSVSSLHGKFITHSIRNISRKAFSRCI